MVDGIPQQRYWIDLSDSADDGIEIIRHMSMEEIPKCVKVIRDSFQTVADDFGITQENAPRYVAFATDEGRLWYHFCQEKRPVFIYLVGDKIVGYYSIAILNDTLQNMKRKWKEE